MVGNDRMTAAAFRELLDAEVQRLAGVSLDDLSDVDLDDFVEEGDTLEAVRGRQLVHDAALEILADNGVDLELDAAGDDDVSDVVREYRVAFVTAAGGWDVVETFTAADDDDANDHAERHYPGTKWFVLDAKGRNVNAGADAGGGTHG